MQTFLRIRRDCKKSWIKLNICHTYCIHVLTFIFCQIVSSWLQNNISIIFIIICVFIILYKMTQSDISVCSDDSNCGGAWYGKRRDWIGQHRFEVPNIELIPVFRHSDLCSDNDQASQMSTCWGNNCITQVYYGCFIHWNKFQNWH